MLSGWLQDPGLPRGGATEPSRMSASWPSSIKNKNNTEVVPWWGSAGSGPNQPDSAPDATHLPAGAVYSVTSTYCTMSSGRFKSCAEHEGFWTTEA